MTERQIKAHYISGTHWDREWYRTFQEYRIMLVELVDGLLDLMEGNGDFQYFHFDGQTCMLADYLEVRPENHPRLQKLISQGRILIGPWFTMPDLLCPGDEALIRNLLLGRKICRQWSVEPMPVAYTCDMFGHPAQMPQIYRSFDMPYCVLGRGTNEHTTPAFFTWESPDGSGVFTFKLQDQYGYGAFYRSRLVMESEDVVIDDEIREKAKNNLKEYVEHEIARTNGTTLCLMDAQDHMPPASDAAGYLKMLAEACPQVKATHSTLPDFFIEAKQTARDVSVRKGELREPSKTSGCSYLWLIPNCPSSRVRMKQANDTALMLLQKWAEPFLVMANLEGAKLPARYLEIAWEQVLLNHAHDSICGCSLDQVHKDMMYRFDQAQMLARQIFRRAFGYLTSRCAAPVTHKDELSVTIANPTTRRRREVVSFDIDLPLDFPTSFQEGFKGSQNIKSFLLTDLQGKEIPYQRLSVMPDCIERTQYAVSGKATDGKVTRYTVAAEIDLPALGFTTILVKPSATPVRYLGTMRTGPDSAENEFLQIKINSNGTLKLTDKQTKQQYDDLLLLEDRSEIGDGWFHAEIVDDEIALSTATAAQVSVIHDGPKMVTFRMEVTLSIPARTERHSERRSVQRVNLQVVHKVSLRCGAKTVDVETSLDNTAEDHRLRLLLPTDAAEAATYVAHQPFAVTERNIALDQQTQTWQEMEIAEKPFLGFQAVGNANRGLAFISATGLHEGGVVDDKRRTMQVTLLRSFRRTVTTSGEPGGQEKGQHQFRYLLLPFAGTCPKNEILNLWEQVQAGICTRQSGKITSGYPAMQGTDPPEKSFVEQLDNRLSICAIKPGQTEDNLVIRLWNPHSQPHSERIKLYRPIKSATYRKLSEDIIADRTPVIEDHLLTVKAGPSEIITIAIEL